MTFDEQGVLDRFHRALVREIHARDPEHVTAPFTVAEIYQNLVPYRTHRDELGVEMNADYEHALLRLLAGEGDFLSIESRTARQEIRDELDSPNPNTGLYRDFAAADVQLNPDKLGDGFMKEILTEATDAGSLEDETLEVEPMEEEDVVEGFEKLEVEPVGASLGPMEDDEGSGELDSESIPPDFSDEQEDVEVVEAGGSGADAAEDAEDLPPFENCPWCREELPQQARVRFCPFCGSNVHLVPCPACGEELRLNWRFCIACGTEVKS